VRNNPAQDHIPEIPGTQRIRYKTAALPSGERIPLYFHIFYPENWKPEDKRPVVLLFHGGGWFRGTPEGKAPHAQYWASRGAVGISAQYRLGIRDGCAVPEDCIADAKSAVRYLRAHAGELGIDPQKIIVGGGSAGAHISAAAATVPGCEDAQENLAISSVPDALLLYYPYSMVFHRENLGPLKHVTPRTPPTLFIAGELDDIAPAKHGITWGEKMHGAPGNLFRLFILRGAQHPMSRMPFTHPLEHESMRQSDLFLKALGFLQGEPTLPPMDPQTPEEQLYVVPAQITR